MKMTYWSASGVGVGAGVFPNSSRRPCLIHWTVRETGLDPTCKYTPSSLGEKFRNGLWASPSESAGKSTTIINPLTPLTGYEPTPSPAAVSALASDIAASDSLANVPCSSLSGSQALYDDGEYTLSPSDRFKDTPERASVTNSGRHPNLDSTIAISFAKFCASKSPATTCIRTFVPAQCWKPANQPVALGGPSKPMRPTWRGRSTVCSARLSACKCVAWLFNSAMRSFERLRSLPQCSSLTSVVWLITNVAITPATRLANNVQLANELTNAAVDKDIPAKGHIGSAPFYHQLKRYHASFCPSRIIRGIVDNYGQRTRQLTSSHRPEGS